MQTGAVSVPLRARGTYGAAPTVLAKVIQGVFCGVDTGLSKKIGMLCSTFIVMAAKLCRVAFCSRCYVTILDSILIFRLLGV